MPAPPLGYATPEPTSQLRAVGLAQRRIMWVILAALLLVFSFVFGAILIPPDQAPETVMLVGLALVRVAILALMMIGVFQLAAALGAGMTARVLYTVAMLIPLVNLILLLVVNQQATALLRRHYIKVGLMGARVADLPPA